MNQKQQIVGSVLLVLLMIVCIFGSIMLLRQWSDPQGKTDAREPLPGFGYCSSRQIKPCILSFTLNPDGSMAINILTVSTFQDFYIKITNATGEKFYECKKARETSIHVTCTGEAIRVGETLNFILLSKAKNTTLAAGNFPVIGLALATPEIAITPTYIPAFDHRPR